MLLGDENNIYLRREFVAGCVCGAASLVALRHHDARVGGSIPGIGSFNTVRTCIV